MASILIDERQSESLQLIIKKVLFELVDIFNNTFGVTVGYCLYLFYKKMGEMRQKI